MTDKQPEALRLANAYFDDHWFVGTKTWCGEAANELRRLHEVNAELVEALQWIAAMTALPTQYQTLAKIVLAKAQGDNK